MNKNEITDAGTLQDTRYIKVLTDTETGIECFAWWDGFGSGIQTMCVRVNRHGKPIINSDFKSDKSSDDDDPNLKADW